MDFQDNLQHSLLSHLSNSNPSASSSSATPTPSNAPSTSSILSPDPSDPPTESSSGSTTSREPDRMLPSTTHAPTLSPSVAEADPTITMSNAYASTSASASTSTPRPPSWPLTNPKFLQANQSESESHRPHSTPGVFNLFRHSRNSDSLMDEMDQNSMRQSYQTTVSGYSNRMSINNPNNLVSRFSSNTSMAVSRRTSDVDDDTEIIPDVPSLPTPHRFGGRFDGAQDIELEDPELENRRGGEGEGGSGENENLTRRNNYGREDSRPRSRIPSLPPGADPRMGFGSGRGAGVDVEKGGLMDKEWEGGSGRRKEREAEWEREMEEKRFRSGGMDLDRTHFWGAWKYLHLIYPLILVSHIPITIFFDFNVLYSLVQIASHSSSVSSAPSENLPPQDPPLHRLSRGWYLTLAIYAASTLAWFILLIHFYLRYLRRWRDGGRPIIVEIFKDNSAFKLTCLRSYSYYSFLMRLWLSSFPNQPFASIKNQKSWLRDAVREHAAWYVQNWPTIVTLVPRTGIAATVLLIYAPSKLTRKDPAREGFEGGGRDGTYFGPTGTLSPYAAISILIYILWNIYRILLVLTSYAIILLMRPNPTNLMQRLGNILEFCSTLTTTNSSRPNTLLLSSHPPKLSLSMFPSNINTHGQERQRLSSQITNQSLHSVGSPTDTNNPLWTSAGSTTTGTGTGKRRGSSIGTMSYDEHMRFQEPILPPVPSLQSNLPLQYAHNTIPLDETIRATSTSQVSDAESHVIPEEIEEERDEDEEEEMRLFEYEQRRAHYTHPALSNIIEEGSEDHSWRRSSATPSGHSADTSRSFPPRPEAPTPASDDSSERERLR